MPSQWSPSGITEELRSNGVRQGLGNDGPAKRCKVPAVSSAPDGQDRGTVPAFAGGGRLPSFSNFWTILVSRPHDSRHNSRAGHPGWRRCLSLTNSRFARSSRLASRAPRSGTYATNHAVGTVAARGETPASHRGRRGAPRARRDDREYREYLSEEQRSRRGCIAGRMQLAFHHGLLAKQQAQTTSDEACVRVLRRGGRCP
jgi:hypothetical protein